MSMTTKWLLGILIAVIVGSTGFFIWQYSVLFSPQPQLIEPKTATKKPVSTTVKKDSTTVDTTLVYKNSKYGFSLTFPKGWEGYKMKEVNVDGTTTYYVNIPTKDATDALDTTADKGFYAPFAITAYTAKAWAEAQAGGGTQSTEIAKNDKYVFTWSSANGIPPSDFTGKDDIKGIIDSFKLD